MNIKTIILLTVITAATTFAAAPQYEVVDLGTAGSEYGSQIIPMSINDRGQIVGQYSYEYGSGVLPVMFDSSGSGNYTFLSSERSGANSINNNGQIVGSMGSPARAILFGLSDSAGHTDLDTSDGYDYSVAIAINDFGIIAGKVEVDDTVSSAIFDYNNPGSITILPNTSGYNNSYTWSMNNSGQVVGYVGGNDYSHRYRGDVGNYQSSAILYEGSEMIQLGTLGGNYSMACDINNNGQIVGSAEDADGREYATIFDSTGQGNNVSLGSLDGKESIAMANNDTGAVVGVLLEKDAYGDIIFNYAIFYYNGSQMVDLQDCIPSDSGWNIDVPWDMNNLGQIIGWGSLDGQQHAILLNPVPEPTTLTIFVIGVLLTRRRKHV